MSVAWHSREEAATVSPVGQTRAMAPKTATTRMSSRGSEVGEGQAPKADSSAYRSRRFIDASADNPLAFVGQLRVSREGTVGFEVKVALDLEA